MTTRYFTYGIARSTAGSLQGQDLKPSYGLHLLHGLSRQLTQLTPVCLYSQVLIKAPNNQCSHPGQHILDLIHNGTEKLHAKHDGGVVDSLKNLWGMEI